MVDGSMLFTDDDWQESKVGRVFKVVPRQSKSKKYHSWDITHSEYVAKRGHWKLFAKEFERLLPPKSPCQKVFITEVRYGLDHGCLSSTLMQCIF